MKLDQGHQSNTLKSLNTKCEVANQMYTMKVWSEALAPAEIRSKRLMKLEADLPWEGKMIMMIEAGALLGVLKMLMTVQMNHIRDLSDNHPHQQEMMKYTTNVAKIMTELTNLAM